MDRSREIPHAIQMPPLENDFLRRIAVARGFNTSEPVLKKVLDIARGNPGGLTVLHMLSDKLKAMGEPESTFEKWVDFFKAGGQVGEDLWVVYKYTCHQNIDEFYCHFARLMPTT